MIKIAVIVKRPLTLKTVQLQCKAGGKTGKAGAACARDTGRPGYRAGSAPRPRADLTPLNDTRPALSHLTLIHCLPRNTTNLKVARENKNLTLTEIPSSKTLTTLFFQPSHHFYI